MASNYTKNYQLNQWEPEDKVVRTDFNADNAKIDAAIAALAGQLSGKADKNAVSTLSSRVETVAESGLRLVIGSYEGSGSGGRSISFSSTLGRPPLVFIIADSVRPAIWIKPTSSSDTGLDWVTWSGNTISWNPGSAYNAHNEKGQTYRYFALG